ncbi:MAG: hypothetical protein AAF334_04030 [Pseudomonadota bacterium]
MSWMQRAVAMLCLAGLVGLSGVPTLAIMFAVAGLLLLDAVLIGSLWRLLLRLRRD